MKYKSSSEKLNEFWNRTEKEKEKKRRKRKEQRIGKEKKRKKKKERKEREIDELIILQKEEKIVGALERRKRRWKKKIKVSKEVWSWLEKGVPLLFEKRKRPKPRIIKEIRMEKEAEEVLKRYIKEQEDLGFIKEEETPPTVVSPIFVIPKKEKGKWRVIIDLRYVNRSQQPPKFKHENWETLGEMLRPGDFMTKGDIKHGFHHLKMREEHSRFLGFRHGKKWYRYIAMPMGSASSPYIFNRMVKPVIQHLREKGIRIVWYVDDFLIAAESKEKVEEQTLETLKLFRELGWHINWEKSVIEAKQEQEFLGLVVDTKGDQPILKVPYKKKRDLRREVRRLILEGTKGPVPVRRVAKVVGMCQAISRAMATTPVYLRNLMRAIPRMRKEEWNTKKVELTSRAKMDLLEWLEILGNWNGQALIRRPTDTVLDTDASDTGWGAFLVENKKKAGGLFNNEWRRQHINLKELQAVLWALETFKNELKGKRILLRIDNQVAMAYVNRMTGRIPVLAEIARKIVKKLEELEAEMHAIYIPSKENVMADKISREIDFHDWEISKETFKKLDLKFGPHTIDQFACNRTKKILRYNSRLGDPGAEGVDSLNLTWEGENNWIVPPIPLIGKVVRKLKKEKAEATIIVPEWRGRIWFQELIEMARAQETVNRKEILKNNATWKQPTWNFRVFKIYGENTQKDGQRKQSTPS